MITKQQLEYMIFQEELNSRGHKDKRMRLMYEESTRTLKKLSEMDLTKPLINKLINLFELDIACEHIKIQEDWINMFNHRFLTLLYRIKGENEPTIIDNN